LKSNDVFSGETKSGAQWSQAWIWDYNVDRWRDKVWDTNGAM